MLTNLAALMLVLVFGWLVMSLVVTIVRAARVARAGFSVKPTGPSATVEESVKKPVNLFLVVDNDPPDQP